MKAWCETQETQETQETWQKFDSFEMFKNSDIHVRESESYPLDFEVGPDILVLTDAESAPPGRRVRDAGSVSFFWAVAVWAAAREIA